MAAEDAVPVWRAEPIARSGKKVIIFYLDDDVRGQITTETPEEEAKWLSLLSILNSKKG
jgi:hypothetical protein